MKLNALALLCALAAPARGEPCPASSAMRRGAVASCDGVLVPATRVAQCLTDHHELAGCRVRLAGEVEARRVAEESWRHEVARLELALDAEREAGQRAYEPRTDWSAIGWGVVVGLVVGALAVAVPVLAR
jgi:hypothetical protein